MVIQNIGSLLGWILVASLTITLANYPIKRINRLVVKKLPDTSSTRRRVGGLARILSRYHRFFALTSLLILIGHFILQFTYRYLSLTGLIAGGLVIITSTVGIYGHYIKHKKRSVWFYIHRTLAVLIIIAVLIHIIMGGLPAINIAFPSSQP